MKPAGIRNIKEELAGLTPKKLRELLLKLSKYKIENKEYLSYLLFESENETNYIRETKEQIDAEFNNLNTSQIYLAKKTIRKVLRTVNKHIKFSDKHETEVELLLYFCFKLKKSGLPLNQNSVLGNLFERQILRIKKAISKLHEDLQFDYTSELKQLTKS